MMALGTPRAFNACQNSSVCGAGGLDVIDGIGVTARRAQRKTQSPAVGTPRGRTRPALRRPAARQGDAGLRTVRDPADDEVTNVRIKGAAGRFPLDRRHMPTVRCDRHRQVAVYRTLDGVLGRGVGRPDDSSRRRSTRSRVPPPGAAGGCAIRLRAWLRTGRAASASGARRQPRRKPVCHETPSRVWPDRSRSGDRPPPR